MFNTEAFKHKSAMVTGGSNGVGAQIAQRLLAAGAKVIIADKAAPEDVLSDALYIPCDFADVTSIDNLFKHEEVKRGVDILINTARGPRGDAPLAESAASFDAGINIALRAPLLLSQHFITMQSPSQTNLQTAIVNISSVCASYVSGESVSYHLAKAGLESMTRYLAVYGGKKGVRVNAVAPGFIVADAHSDRFNSEENTAYREKACKAHPLNRVGSEQNVTDAVLFLASSNAAFITGQTLSVDGGLNLRDGWCQLNDFELKG